MLDLFIHNHPLTPAEFNFEVEAIAIALGSNHGEVRYYFKYRPGSLDDKGAPYVIDGRGNVVCGHLTPAVWAAVAPKLPGWAIEAFEPEGF